MDTSTVADTGLQQPKPKPCHAGYHKESRQMNCEFGVCWRGRDMRQGLGYWWQLIYAGSLGTQQISWLGGAENDYSVIFLCRTLKLANFVLTASHQLQQSVRFEEINNKPTRPRMHQWLWSDWDQYRGLADCPGAVWGWARMTALGGGMWVIRAWDSCYKGAMAV